MAISKEDLKKTLKPIIKECVRESIKEMLLEGSLLSGLVKEVAGGLMSQVGTREQLVEQSESVSTIHKPKPNVYEHVQMRAKNASLGEAKERLVKKLGKNVFAGIAEDDQIVNASPESIREGKINIPSRGSIPSSAESMADPLRDIDPNDPGIPLDGIAELAGGMGKWAHLLNKKK